MMIKNAKQKFLALATALALTLTMAGCTAQSTQETESAEPQQTQEVQQTENAAGGTENVEIPDTAEEVAAFDPEYSDRDKSGAWDESEAVSIALSDGGSTISGEGAEVSGNVVTVTQAGVYVLSGLLSNGRIVVEAGDEDKVQVVLSGASITSSDGPAIWVKSADKVFLTLAEGTENALADGETYTAEDDANACVWAECDLTINGSGKLKVQASDLLDNRQLHIDADMVVLAAAIEPDKSARPLATMLTASMDTNDFFTEAHPKLRPVESPTAGVFLSGMCQGPKDIPETVAQASAAAAKVIGLLCKDSLTCNPCVAQPDEMMCNGCSNCEKVCPYGAITYIDKEFRGPNRTTLVRRVAQVNPAVCQGCGACTVACMSGAMDLKGFSNRQIIAEVDAICR